MKRVFIKVVLNGGCDNQDKYVAGLIAELPKFKLVAKIANQEDH